MTWFGYSVNAATTTDPALTAEINFGSGTRSRDGTTPSTANQPTLSSHTSQTDADNQSNQSNHSKTLMTNILNSFRSRSSSQPGGGSGGASTSTGARAGLRRQLSKRKSPPVTTTTTSSNESESEADEKDTVRHRIRLLPHLENSRSPNFSITTRQLKPGARLRIGRFTDKQEEGAMGVFEDDAKKLLGGGGDPLSLSLAFRSKVVSRSHAEISVNDEGRVGAMCSVIGRHS